MKKNLAHYTNIQDMLHDLGYKFDVMRDVFLEESNEMGLEIVKQNSVVGVGKRKTKAEIVVIEIQFDQSASSVLIKAWQIFLVKKTSPKKLWAKN